MTRELAKKILKQYAQRAYCGEIMTPNPEELEALFEGVKALERLERLNAPEVNMPHYDRYKQKPEPIPIIQASDGTVWPLSVFEPKEPTPEAWKAGAELCNLINGIFEKRMKELELERERKEGAKDDI